ncbi:macrolide family glycosyltransferase [Streptomyces sp. ODS05-4]|uniref:macrolide family glycosyltransferase n=1 Tax=Streptomyces sp. ODS05-4 TaxID=2944939 RepID=UPI00210B519D|nr:macrolide family glycosyltransferase [Streptomyces sp. ODS05-4]
MKSSAHIAMFSIGFHGHVNPSLGVLRELIERGHRVTYAVPPAMAEKVAATGAEPRVWDSIIPSPDEVPDWGASLLDRFVPFLDDAIQAMPRLLDLYDHDRPDLVLYDITVYPARVLARRWNVPAINLSPNIVAWRGYREAKLTPMWQELRTSQEGRAYEDRYRRWLREYDITESPESFRDRIDRSLVLIPKALQPHAELVDGRVYSFVGGCQADRSSEGTWERPVNAETVVLVSLGSSFTKRPDFYRACVRAFGEMPGWHVVLQIGGHVDPGELGTVPDNVEVRSWVPQLSVLEQADLFVTHAGAGGCQEGIATTTPMIAVPQAVDQFSNAAMLQAQGIARHIPMDEVTIGSLRDAALHLVGNPEIAHRLTELRRELAAEGGARRAADLIEAELHAARN